MVNAIVNTTLLVWYGYISINTVLDPALSNIYIVYVPREAALQ